MDRKRKHFCSYFNAVWNYRSVQQKIQIRAAITQQHLPLYDRIGLTIAGNQVPEFYEEVEDANPDADQVTELFPDDESELSELADILSICILRSKCATYPTYTVDVKQHMHQQQQCRRK